MRAHSPSFSFLIFSLTAAATILLRLLYSNLGALTANGSVTKFTPQADGLYATYKVGADTVIKKLGSTQQTGSIGAYIPTLTLRDIVITFEKPFINIPYFGIFYNSLASNQNQFNIKNMTVTRTNATITFFNMNDTWAPTINITWIAVEK